MYVSSILAEFNQSLQVVHVALTQDSHLRVANGGNVSSGGFTDLPCACLLELHRAVSWSLEFT